MKSTTRWVALSLSLALPVAAQASNVAYGETVYRARCASCHNATASNERAARRSLTQEKNAPNLGEVSAKKNAQQLGAWVANPWSINPNTACDTRGLTSTQQNDVVAFMVSKAKPVPPPESERLKRALDRELVERAMRKPAGPGGANTGSTGSSKKRGGK